jgi:ferredoxin-fold anticodon binding domain-containing protein
MKERLIKLIGKKIALTCVFGNSEPIFYTGVVKEVKEDFLVILDKFGKNVAISFDSIKKLEELE